MKSAFLALLTAATLAAQVKITQNTGRISVDVDGKPFTEFWVSGPDVPKPYLHPLRAASDLRPSVPGRVPESPLESPERFLA